MSDRYYRPRAVLSLLTTHLPFAFSGFGSSRGVVKGVVSFFGSLLADEDDDTDDTTDSFSGSTTASLCFSSMSLSFSVSRASWAFVLIWLVFLVGALFVKTFLGSNLFEVQSARVFAFEHRAAFCVCL